MTLSTLVLALLAGSVAVGLSLLMGYAGQVSLGQASFYMIGAYTAALIATHSLPTWLGLLGAPAAAAVAAALLAVPLFRLRGHQLAFATLAVQLILLNLAGQQDWTGGDIGLQAIPLLTIGGYEFTGDGPYACLALTALIIVALTSRNIIASRPGRGLRALATSEVAAASSGVPVAGYKLAVFSLSAAFAGLAGGIYAFYIGYVSPSSFPILLSIEYVVMVVVGGTGSIWGAMAGAGAITVLLQMLNDLGAREGMPTTAPTVLSYGLFGTLLIAIMLFVPRGLVPTAIGLWQSRVNDTGPPTPTSEQTPERDTSAQPGTIDSRHRL